MQNESLIKSQWCLHVVCVMAGNDDELERRAVEELLKEAKRGRVRAETMGPAGWMKCPLGSTNKRFLLNSLRPCSAERQSGSRSPMAKGAEDSREEGGRGSRHRPEGREHGYRKDTKHRRERHRSYSQSSRPRDSSTSELASTGHANQSNGSRSRSPIKERFATKRSTDRTQK